MSLNYLRQQVAGLLAGLGLSASGAGDHDALHFRVDGESAREVLANLVNVNLSLLSALILCSCSSFAFVSSHCGYVDFLLAVVGSTGKVRVKVTLADQSN